MSARGKSSADPAEISRFARDSDRWWDESGPFRPLHRLNPVRLSYIRDTTVAHFDLNQGGLNPLKGLNILDIGCGGGLVCEPLARMGAHVTGIDADERAIATAKQHAESGGLSINYQCATPETLRAGRLFDVVTALEIVEHVTDRDIFVSSCAALCKPGGLVIFSTLNRSAKSLALGVVAAEYILKWVPRGTHDWRKFVKPSELARSLRQSGLFPKIQKGIIFSILNGEFELSDDDFDVNYMMVAVKT